MGKAKSVTGSDSGSKTVQASTVKKSSAQPRVSKRGANEDSEVRYDTKHVQKKQKNGKKNSKKAGKDDEKVDSLDSDAGTSDDTNSVVSGNEDDKGSVVSALLEEDICYQCGEGTMNGDDWGEVVMCDICDGEYHLKCQNLTCTPEGSFFCTKCKDDEEHFKDMRFEVSSSFKVCICANFEAICDILTLTLRSCINGTTVDPGASFLRALSGIFSSEAYRSGMGGMQR